MVGRMLKWSLELLESDIQYKRMKALKAQALGDFVAKITTPEPPTGSDRNWKIFMDGASSSTGSGAGILLKNEEGIVIKHLLTLSFPTSNNQAEYEALLAGLRLAEDLGTREVQIFTNS